MDSDDESNQFVMNELIGPCSSDDENDLFFFGAVHMIIEDLVRHHSSGSNWFCRRTWCTGS